MRHIMWDYFMVPTLVNTPPIAIGPWAMLKAGNPRKEGCSTNDVTNVMVPCKH